MKAEPVKKSSWLYTLPHNVTFQLDHDCKVAYENSFIKIELNGEVTVKRGYSWNGCTPKINILDTWLVGTPEGNIDHSTGKPNTYYASCLHDALYQFGIGSGAVTRRQSDIGFKKYLGEHKARPAYYGMVRTFGGVSRWLASI